MTETTETQKNNRILDWILRLLKGILVGVGFITPGLSGGVLAVVFGLYEPLMRFLGNLREKFLRNVLFFIPVGIGGVIGVVVFSAAVDWAFENYELLAIWLFVGFIAGTFPSLMKTAGKQGRKTWHWLLLGLSAVGMFFLMRLMERMVSVQIAPSFISWLLSGALIGLGVVVPGMSPSNFLIYLGLYQPMAAGIKNLNLGVVIPLCIGGAVIVLLLAKLVSWLFKKFYAVLYHLILGIVVGSTVAIIPAGVGGWSIALAALLFVFGGLISYGLAKLEEKYSREELFT